MNRELAPIVVFAYDRPEHLRRTLDALSQNDLAKDSVLYIYCDGARSLSTENIQGIPFWQHKSYFYGTKEQYDTYICRIEQTKRVAWNQKGFKEIHVIERTENIGLADNIVGAVTEIIGKYDRVIAFEDDIVSTKGCLTYLNDALELYKNDEKVMHISAWMYPNKGQFPTTFFYDSPYPAGGWATWKRAWQHFNPDTADHVAFWKNNWKEFDIEGGDYLSRQLIGNLDGTLKTWYIKWYSSMRRQNGLCLYPRTAMSNNIGWDDSGETSCMSNRYRVINPAIYTNVQRIPIVRNRKAFNYIRVWYSGHWYSKRYRIALANKIKNILH